MRSREREVVAYQPEPEPVAVKEQFIVLHIYNGDEMLEIAEFSMPQKHNWVETSVSLKKLALFAENTRIVATVEYR